MNKKGDLTGIIFFIVMISAFAIFLLIVGYIVPQITVPLANQIGISAEINNSLNASSNVAANTLPTVWMVMFAGLMLGLFATAWFIPTHPIFVPAFAILLIIAIVVAIPISNAYEQLSQEATLAGTATEQSLIVFLMTKLPFVAFIVGLIVMVISFAKPGGSDVSSLA